MAKATWLWIKGSVRRARCWVDESWRRSRHQWLCRQVLLDFTTAVLCFLVMIWLTSLSRAQVPLKSWLAALLSTVGLATVFYGLLAATRFLVKQSDYESLVSAAKPPRLDRISQSEGGRWSHAISLCHRYPLTAVLLFAGLVGLNIAVWLRRSVGPDVRMVLLKALEPIPPFAYGGRLLCGSIDEPFWLWRWLLTFLFSLIAWKIVTAWLQRNEVRNRFVAGLFTENRRGPSAYGLTHGESTKEPHEQVLLDQSKRIGAAALPYLRVTLGAEEWKGAEADPDRCRGVPAVLSRVFHSDGKWCWEGFPEESRWITTWLLSHLESLVGRDLRAAPDEPAGDVTPSDHRLGEALVAAASAIASFRFRPKLDASKASDASHLEMQSKQASKCREHLRAAFAAAPRRPELLLAACGAAERLGTADDLRLLDEQTRKLDVQMGFLPRQTDVILETRDRVLSREPHLSELREKWNQQIFKMGLKHVRSGNRGQQRFRRPSDGAEMVLVPAGSFVRGDDRARDAFPRRRVHLGAYLIDVDPVSQSRFEEWTRTQGEILRVDRGFFPVQVIDEGASKHSVFASHVTWYAARAYAAWAIQGGDLPTESQWEKAARGADDSRRFPSGEVWNENEPSPFGVRICHLQEWTRDRYSDHPQRDCPLIFDPWLDAPRAVAAEVPRVVRGRNAEVAIDHYSLAERLGMEPFSGAVAAEIGFRVVVPLDAGDSA